MMDAVARALLYEGYLLYPYRGSSLKNQQRWPLGVVFPATWSSDTDPCSVRTECLVETTARTQLQIGVYFLHLVELPGDNSRVQPAVERHIDLPPLSLPTLETQGYEEVATLPPQDGCGGTQQTLRVSIRAHAEMLDASLCKLTVDVRNVSPCALPYHNGMRTQALQYALLSTHTRLTVRDGSFVSMLEPSPRHAPQVHRCHNAGTWPVLMGAPGERSSMLSSPIILYDYPRVAKESPGDLFDGGEIDEILTLRILTLTDEEKAQMRATDPRVRDLLDRTERLTQDDLMQMHGMVRRVHTDAPPAHWQVRGVTVRAGSKVRLQPQGRNDIFDVALKGRDATVVAIEQDLEDKVLIAVTVDDDPGKDLGEQGQVGHRFFFRPDEIEVLSG